MNWLPAAATVMTALLFTACEGSSLNDDQNGTESLSIDTAAEESTELAELAASLFSALPEEVDRPSQARVNLGRLLFFDPILSGREDIACATCHHPDLGYSDDRARSIGTGGSGLGSERSGPQDITRNAQSIINTRYNGLTAENTLETASEVMFWDNRVSTLETQAAGPMLSAVEMRSDDYTSAEIIPELISRLAANAEYVSLFEAAFAGRAEPLSEASLVEALADYERTITAVNTPFDRYLRGDTSALNEEQLAGLNRFIEIGCATCHSGPMLTDYQLHRLNVPGVTGDDGDGSGRFRTPTLRNLSVTGPYMHNGELLTLEEVLGFYNRVANPPPGTTPPADLDPLVADLEEITPEDRRLLLAFFSALEDNSFDRTIPGSVPSGLPPGALD